MKKLLIILVLSLLYVPVADAGTPRSEAAVRAFKKANPCPVAASTTHSCPGYVVDHIIPLCGGGIDAPGNMQWQKAEDSYLKDTRERAYCKCLKNPTSQCEWTVA
jgi:hypothetical protein